MKAFEAWLKKGAKGTDYIIPTEMLVMMNVIVDFKNQVCIVLYCIVLYCFALWYINILLKYTWRI